MSGRSYPSRPTLIPNPNPTSPSFSERRGITATHTRPPRSLSSRVADATLDFDRQRKQILYARAGIPEYWIVNLIDRCVEVYRGPGPASNRSSRKCLPGEIISPLAASGAEIAVSDILP